MGLREVLRGVKAKKVSTLPVPHLVSDDCSPRLILRKKCHVCMLVLWRIRYPTRCLLCCNHDFRGVARCREQSWRASSVSAVMAGTCDDFVR